MKKSKTRKLTIMAMLVAIAIILVYLVRIPIFPIAPFLEYDPADIAIIIGTLGYGMGAGFMLTIVVSLLQGLTVSAGSGIIGVTMHIFATGALVCGIAIMANKRKNKRNANTIACIIGTLCMTISMIIWNLVFTPLFLGVPMESVIAILVPAIIPFNLIKGGLNSILAFLIYDKILKKYF